MMRYFFKWTLFVVLLSFFSCSQIEEFNDTSLLTTPGVYGAFDSVVDEDSPDTKANVDPDNSWSYVFEVGDRINIWSSVGTLLVYSVTTGGPTAKFSGGGFDLVPGETYYSSHPLILSIGDTYKSLTTTYEGQTQVGNNNAKHIADYMYTYAESQCKEDGSTFFQYHHLSSFMRFVITLPKAMTPTEISITGPADFDLDGKVDITTHAFTAAKKSKVMTLKLQDVTITESNKVLTAFLAAAPFAAGDFVISVTDSEGKVYTSPAINKATATAAGNAKRFEVNVFEESAGVAQIGSTVYPTLEEAIAAVPTDGTETTITLLDNVSSDWYVVNDGKNIVLDLAGYTITGNFDQYDSELMLKNGEVAGTVYVNTDTSNEDYNTFTLDESATITSPYAIILYQADQNKGYGSTIDINGTVNGMVWVMGNIADGNSVINVNDGATVKGDLGVALNGFAIVNVADGATIEGSESGIEVRAGTLNVTGGNIKSTAAVYKVEPNGSGTTTIGAAVAVAQHTTKLATTVNITGNPTLTGIKTISVADPQENGMENVTVTVADALLGASVVIPEKFEWVSNGNATSTLKPVQDSKWQKVTSNEQLTSGKFVLVYPEGTTYKLFSFEKTMQNAQIAFDMVKDKHSFEEVLPMRTELFQTGIHENYRTVTAEENAAMLEIPEAIAAEVAMEATTPGSEDSHGSVLLKSTSVRDLKITEAYVKLESDKSVTIASQIDAVDFDNILTDLRGHQISVTFANLVDFAGKKVGMSQSAMSSALTAFDKLCIVAKDVLAQQFGGTLMDINHNTRVLDVFTQYYDNVAPMSYAYNPDVAFGWIKPIGFYAANDGFSVHVPVPASIWFDRLDASLDAGTKAAFVQYWKDFDVAYPQYAQFVNRTTLFGRLAEKLLYEGDYVSDELFAEIANINWKALGQSYQRYADSLNGDPLEKVYLYKLVEE